MFDIGWGELLLIGIVALIAIGPKELPTVLRTLGQWMAKLRRMASEFQNQFHEAMREAEMADLKKQVDEVTSQAQSYANFDPVGEVRREFESAQRQIDSAIADKPTVHASPSPPATDSGSPAVANPAGGERTAPSADGDAAAPATAGSEAGTRDAGTHDAGGKPA
jgi:sec-independent protein translocase protein TatB